MKIEPYVVDKNGIEKRLAFRELRIDEKSMAIARYKRKLFYVSNDYQILTHLNLPNQDIYTFVDSLDDVKFIENRSVSRNFSIDFPDPKSLLLLADMGIDKAVYALRLQAREDNEARLDFSRALKLRKRYNAIPDKTFSECLAMTKKATNISPVISTLRGRVLAYPFNSSHLLSNLKKNGTFRVSDYLSGKLSPDGYRNTVATNSLKKYFDANLFFHQAIFSSSREMLLDKDILNYETEDLSFDGAQNPYFHIKSKEYFRYTSNWKQSTKQNLKRMAAEFVRRYVDREANEHKQKDNQNQLKKLSIFALASLDFDPAKVNRLKKLHKLGLRQLGHFYDLS